MVCTLRPVGHEWLLKWWIALSTRLISVLRITQLIFLIRIRWIVIDPVDSDLSSGKRNQAGERSLRPSRLTSLGH